MSKLRVLISGAGIAGSCVAHWFLRYGFEPTLVERAPVFRAGGYMIDVWGVGFDMLERYGLLEAARQRGYVFDRLEFVDERGKQLSAVGGEALRRALGGRFFSIPRGDLSQVIYETVENRAEVLYGTSIQALHQHPGGVEVELSVGEARQFDVVIGADGLHSRVRELTFGSEPGFERNLGYLAASFIAHGYPHRDEGAYVSFARPGRQISRYAMRGSRSAFLFVLADGGEAALHVHDSRTQKELLRTRFAHDGWEVPEILERLEAANDLYFDAVSQIRMPRWTDRRIALVGDAAHSPSLLAGAGAAFAMLGAYVLAQEAHQADGNIIRAFPAYERRLRPYMARQQRAAARFAGSFAPKTALGIRVRDAALNLMNLPVLGTWLARRMFANTFPLPLE
jgi:2-polyprenyl-6-methoxyphenol hydroxylase-like FAD-dependent oxidoreductase